MKRFLCLFAVFILIFTAIPVTINAAEEKMNVVYVSDKGNDGADGKSYSMAVKTLTRAMRLCYDGGTIVICGPVKITSSFQSPKTEGHITITSVYGGVDYMKTYSAKLSIGAKFILDGEYTLRDMKIETTQKNMVIVCMGKRVVFDEGISCAAANGANLPSITCGDASNYQNGGARVTVNSGEWLRLRGGNRGTGGSKNGTYIEINGGTFSSVVECGGDSDAYGDAYMLINGGTLNGALRVVGSTDLHGNAYIAVKGGTIKSFKLSDGGKINGKVELYITASGGTYNVSKAYTTGGATVVRSAKQTVSGSCELISDQSKAEAGVKLVEDAINAEFTKLQNAREERINCWFGSFDVTKTGTASLGVKEENNSVELLSANIEVKEDKFNFVGAVALLLAVSAVVGAFILWRKNGTKAAMSALLCPILLAGTVSLFGCEKPPVTSDTTDTPTDTTEITDTTAPITDENEIGWTLYGNAEKSDALQLSAPAFAFSDDKLFKNSRIELTFKVTEEGKAYFFAPVTPKESDGLQITGYCFEADSENDTVSVYYVTKNLRYPIGTKYCKLDVGVEYPVTIVFETLNTRRITFYLNENPLDEDPYPKYELVLDKKSSGQVGFACMEGKAEIRLAGIKEFESTVEEGLTYTNPIITEMTDPDMFYHDGKYYLYGCRNSDSNNLYCYVSDDGVNFTDAGIVMHGKDVWGDKVFKAANILYHDGYFYMFYLANLNSGEGMEAYAYSTSPLGPFISDTKTPLYGRDDQIGGQPFVDEDGKIYLVHVRYGHGNETWLVEIECDKGKVTVKEETYTKLLEANEEWENAIATVLECGYIIKHNDLYYLIYAGGNYNSTYGVGFAVSENIKGPYEKYEGNPVLTYTDQAYGNGAASVFPSPDGTEYFFVYLRHESSVSVRPLNTAMDRFKFVKRADGYDIISVYGPTTTPQPAPSNNGTTKAGELDRFQD